MTYELILTGLATHILIWEKLPEWGTWFNRLLSAAPQPAQRLYEQWRCAYCAGFWIALALHALTGFWTLPGLETFANAGAAARAIAWFLDALATATLIYAATMALKAISLPAMKAHLMKEDFMQAMSEPAEPPQRQSA